jgi:hypothetical protein
MLGAVVSRSANLLASMWGRTLDNESAARSVLSVFAECDQSIRQFAMAGLLRPPMAEPPPTQ